MRSILASAYSFLSNETRIRALLGLPADSPAPLDAETIPVGSKTNPNTMIISNFIHLSDSSLSRIPGKPNSLAFSFTCSVPVTITVMMGVRIKGDPPTVTASSVPVPRTFPVGSHHMDVNCASARSKQACVVAHASGTRTQWDPAAMVWFINLAEIRPEVSRRKLQLDNVFYELSCIYGADHHTPRDQSPDVDGACVICLAGRPTVLALPCRHLMLCEECAASYRARSKHCPVCRCDVERLLVISDK
eukprot:gnl/Dysnectes_brevis/6449_a10013_317.p1 GENE.gnl/Dysnectes_brevis/6449_a10013_317~~gnl/Dysnectes_brevis/6449_a10013_317.p1  ORF type:complete len:247 (+),score=28.89 gnl/Dysnectes_brevis/6449_a10013_317:43-783(+)